MEIVQVKRLSPGDRFALKDWVCKPQNRVVYRIPKMPLDSVDAKKAGRRNQFQCLYAPEGGDGDRQSFSESIQNIKANMIIYEKNSINNQTRSVSGY